MTRMARSAAAISAVALLALTGCGGTSTSATAAAPVVHGTPAVGSLTTAELGTIRQCLEAAGVRHAFLAPFAPGVAGGSPIARPTGAPTPPTGLSGTPIARPTGAPGPGGPTLPGGAFADPQVRRALHHCGITEHGFAPAH